VSAAPAVSQATLAQCIRTAAEHALVLQGVIDFVPGTIVVGCPKFDGRAYGTVLRRPSGELRIVAHRADYNRAVRRAAVKYATVAGGMGIPIVTVACAGDVERIPA